MHEMSRKPKTTLISRLHDPSPALCRVNPLGATTDFTQEDMLDGPSCGDAMRPEEGGSRSGGNSSGVWGCDMCWFSTEFPWLRLLYGVSYFLVQLVPVCGAGVLRYSGIQQYCERSMAFDGARTFRFLQLGGFGI